MVKLVLVKVGDHNHWINLPFGEYLTEENEIWIYVKNRFSLFDFLIVVHELGHWLFCKLRLCEKVHEQFDWASDLILDRMWDVTMKKCEDCAVETTYYYEWHGKVLCEEHYLERVEDERAREEDKKKNFYN